MSSIIENIPASLLQEHDCNIRIGKSNMWFAVHEGAWVAIDNDGNRVYVGHSVVDGIQAMVDARIQLAVRYAK